MTDKIIRPGQEQQLQAALVVDQQAQAAQAHITHFIHMTAIAIYGQLVAQSSADSPEELRVAAARANAAAPFLAEALGMVKLTPTKQE